MTSGTSRLTTVLLGAGASVPAGIPAAQGLTRRALDDTAKDRHGRVLHFVVNALRLHDVRTADSAYLESEPGIERLVSAVELLAHRADLEVTPFVRDWDPMVAELERATSSTFSRSREAEKVIQEIISTSVEAAARKSRNHSSSSTSKKLVKLINEITTVGHTDVFAHLHDSLVARLLTDLTLSPGSSTSYLEPLLAYVSDAGGSIATLNYDLTIEKAASTSGATLNRLVDDWTDTGQLTSTGEGLPYMKLHGSIDWVLTHDGDGVTVMGEELHRGLGGSRPALVYGQREKLRSHGPFLQLLEEFRLRLFQSDQLIIAGYSFGDEHINAIIRRWLKVKPGTRLLLIDPGVPDLLAEWRRPFTERSMLWQNYGAGAGGTTYDITGNATHNIRPQRMFLRRQGLETLERDQWNDTTLFCDIELRDYERQRAETRGTESM